MSPGQNSPPRATWRLLISPPADGATNMAVDEAILHALADAPETGWPTLRFFQWDPPCLSLGYSQRWADVDEAACARLGYTWVRRPTGGRAILHTDELTYSVIAPETEPRLAGSLIESYRSLSRGLLSGLNRLGSAPIQAKGEKGRNPQQSAACFDTPSYYEITHTDGRKLIGSAQVRRRGMVLQHGTLPLRGDITRILEVLNLAEAERASLKESLAARALTLEQALRRPVSFEEAVEAISRGFEQALNLRLEPGELTDREQALVEELRRQRYAAAEWNQRL
ncbi:MAG: biotin/lipoate A/B protein ligase family protein [Anaerolineae bacterium]